MKTKTILSVASLLLVCMLAFAAVADGTWNLSGNVAGAPQRLVLQASGTSLSGTVDGVAITGGRTQDNAIWFNAVRGGVSFSYKGTISGNQLSLFERSVDGSQHRSMTYTRAS